jgi:hypothetical protein
METTHGNSASRHSNIPSQHEDTHICSLSIKTHRQWTQHMDIQHKDTQINSLSARTLGIKTLSMKKLTFTHSAYGHLA